jgi:serine acetyltransferase
VGTNPVVVKDFPNDCIIGGIPGKIIAPYRQERFLIP